MSDLILLSADHVDQVFELVSGFYPEAFHPDKPDLLQSLAADFCLGVEQGGRLSGLLLAWVDRSLVQGRNEKVIYVEDLVAGGRDLEDLLEFLLELAGEAGLEGMPIEGTLCDEVHTLDDFTAHVPTGYSLAGSHSYFDAHTGQQMTWVRFEAVQSSVAPQDVWVGAAVA